MKQFIFITLTTCFFIFYACGSGEQNSKTSVNQNDIENLPNDENIQATGQTNDTEGEGGVQPQENDQVLAWVENLNIREQANIKSKVIAQAKENETLTLTGKKTDFTETIELRGIAYTEPWIEVKTADGKTGWVFQGAVKRPGEEKGNALNTADKFTYPHFGSFDLSSWKKVETKNDSDSEELDRTVDVYTKGGQILEIGTSSVGEFYWSKDYKLMDANKKVIKERELKFTVDPLELTESVKDYSSAPPKQYTRTQKQQQHWYQMNAKPDMATGEWKVSTL